VLQFGGDILPAQQKGLAPRKLPTQFGDQRARAFSIEPDISDLQSECGMKRAYAHHMDIPAKSMVSWLSESSSGNFT
jgi:hypothetical protein